MDAGKAWTAKQIPLEDSLFTGLCRRGRRRLREIEQATRCSVKFDRQRRALWATGTPEGIAQVEAQVESMTGPRQQISRAAWAELMRTRTTSDASSALAQIQQQSGCRVHIERAKNEVRLFGSKTCVEQGAKLLTSLQAICTEQEIPIKTASLPLEVLNSFAQALCVTFRLEDDRLIVLGLIPVARQAAQQLALCLPAGVQTVPQQVLQAAQQQVERQVSWLRLDGSPSTTASEGDRPQERLMLPLGSGQECNGAFGALGTSPPSPQLLHGQTSWQVMMPGIVQGQAGMSPVSPTYMAGCGPVWNMEMGQYQVCIPAGAMMQPCGQPYAVGR
ncbi:unnamed protein product [Effrenium voratum]|nr:unnamed protein product [Effrenium voratum]